MMGEDFVAVCYFGRPRAVNSHSLRLWLVLEVFVNDSVQLQRYPNCNQEGVPVLKGNRVGVSCRASTTVSGSPQRTAKRFLAAGGLARRDRTGAFVPATKARRRQAALRTGIFSTVELVIS